SSKWEPPSLLEARALLASDSHKRFRRLLQQAQGRLFLDLVHRASSDADRLRIQAQAQVLEWILGPAEAESLTLARGIDRDEKAVVDSVMDVDEPYEG